MKPSCQVVCSATAFAALLALPLPLVAQDGKTAVAEPSVQLDFAPQMELKLLVDYVSQRLELGILYDDQIADKRVTIRAPRKVPVSSLLELLQSVLRMHDLSLVDVGDSGWKQIVSGKQMPAMAPLADARQIAEGMGLSTPVTQTFTLKNINSAFASQLILPFLTGATGPGAQAVAGVPGGAVPAGKVVAVENQNLIIVTDYAGTVAKVARLIDFLNVRGPDVIVELMPLKHVVAADMATQLSSVIKSKLKAQQDRGDWVKTEHVEIDHDDRMNQLIVLGRRSNVQQIMQLARSLDVSVNETTKSYQLRHAAAEHTDQLLQELLTGADGESAFRSAVDSDQNRLLVTAQPDVHRQIQSLVVTLDVAKPEGQSPLGIFKLENTPAWQILTTLRSLQGEGTSASAGGSADGYDGTRAGPGVSGSSRGFGGNEAGFGGGMRSGPNSTLRSGAGRSNRSSPSSTRRLGSGRFGN